MFWVFAMAAIVAGVNGYVGCAILLLLFAIMCGD